MFDSDSAAPFSDDSPADDFLSSLPLFPASPRIDPRGKRFADMTEKDIAALIDWKSAKRAILHLRGIRNDNERRRRAGHPGVPAQLDARQVTALCDFLNLIGDRL